MRKNLLVVLAEKLVFLPHSVYIVINETGFDCF